MKLADYVKPIVNIITIMTITLNSATAGLIIGNQEFLDIGLTQNKNIAEIHTMITNNTELSGYTLATDIDMAMIHSLLPHSTNGNSGWHTLTSPLTITQQNIVNWYQTGFSVQYDNEYSANGYGGNYTFNEYQYGTMRYKDSITFGVETGDYDFNGYYGQTVAIFNRNDDDAMISDLTNIETSGGGNFSSSRKNLHSLFVRKIDVPEPSTFAIFALAFAGLLQCRKRTSHK